MEPRESSTQNIVGPLTSAAIFLVVSIRDLDPDTAQRHVPDGVVETIAGIEDLVKTVGFRQPGARLSCTVGIGSDAWTAIRAGGASGDPDPAPAPATGDPDPVSAPAHAAGAAPAATGDASAPSEAPAPSAPSAHSAPSAPAELHPFREFVGAVHAARATRGDLLFHIRADRQDLAYEFERLLLNELGDAVRVEDEVSGFRYFDGRDLLGFVDGTANPVGPDLPASALIGDEDPEFAGGSYVVVQKYLHDLPGWAGLTVEDQETVIGRTKSDNVELPDAEHGQRSHKTLTTITDAEGEHDIVRDNMPFATPGSGIHGTYFIGYSRRLSVIERMLERMFIGDPPGKHDRILDFSTAATGSTYFVPAPAMLASLAG